jgi:hypothetical protein
VIRFERTNDPLALPGRLQYVEREHSLRFESSSRELEASRAGQEGEASLALGTLQLHFGVETGLVLYPDGYFPRQAWHFGTLSVPQAASGAVRVTLDGQAIPGVSYRLDGLPVVETVHDEASGWLRVSGGTSPEEAADYVEVAQGVVLEVLAGGLRALWLHPEPEP